MLGGETLPAPNPSLRGPRLSLSSYFAARYLAALPAFSRLSSAARAHRIAELLDVSAAVVIWALTGTLAEYSQQLDDCRADGRIPRPSVAAERLDLLICEAFRVPGAGNAFDAYICVLSLANAGLALPDIATHIGVPPKVVEGMWWVAHACLTVYRRSPQWKALEAELAHLAGPWRRRARIALLIAGGLAVAAALMWLAWSWITSLRAY